MTYRKFSSIEELQAEIEAYEKITKKTFKKLEDLPPHKLKERKLRQQSQLPNATNLSNTVDKFESRKAYKDLVNNLYYPKGEEDLINGFYRPLDTWYKNPLYGRIDHKNNLIYHNYWIFTNISDDPSNPICVFDFVARAFENMKAIFFERQLSRNSDFLTDLKAQSGLKSTISIEEKYEAHLEQVYLDFESSRGNELKFSKDIKNFDDFTHEFVRYCINEEKLVSFPGFVDSLNIDIYDSYLAFDILPESRDGSDKRKIDFLNDKNYFVYEYAARQAGFFTDPNKPWRLIADIRSIPMINSMRIKYNQVKTFLDTEAFLKKVIDASGYDLSAYEFNQSKKLIEEEATDDIDKFLYFIDFFRIELFDKLETFNRFKELILKYDNKDKLKKAGYTGSKVGQGYGGLMEEEKDPDAFEDNLNLLAQLYYLLVEELQGKKDLVEFIYDSLRKEEKILHFSTASTFLSITDEKTYNSLYSSVYDYAYYTYFPLKLDRFYEKYTAKYPSYGVFDKPNKRIASIFSKKIRKENLLSDVRLTTDLQNDFFDIKFLKSYLDLRLSEENKTVSSDIRLLILSEVKEVYLKSLELYNKKDIDFIEFRSVCLKIIEGFIGLPYNKQKPVSTMMVKKKATMMAYQAHFNKNLIEPRIKTERLCCKLPEIFDILAEREPCPEFITSQDVGPSIAKENPTTANLSCKELLDKYYTGFKQDYWPGDYTGAGQPPKKTGDTYLLPVNNLFIFDIILKKWFQFIPKQGEYTIKGKCVMVPVQKSAGDTYTLVYEEECQPDILVQAKAGEWKEIPNICLLDIFLAL